MDDKSLCQQQELGTSLETLQSILTKLFTAKLKTGSTLQHLQQLITTIYLPDLDLEVHLKLKPTPHSYHCSKEI